MSLAKKFDPELFKQNDFRARDAAKDFLLSQGQKAVDNTDKYGPDLVLEDGSFVEVEVKHTWKDRFAFDSLQVPFRKEKFAKLGCLFLVFNDDCSKVFIVRGEDILTSPVKEIHNKYVSAGELFYQVPLSAVKEHDVAL